eukprot:m.67797 g.67797  ORF g.67797 m.67797 type:complete len:71 (+) comp8227_c2_seq3:1715-1927(+)
MPPKLKNLVTISVVVGGTIAALYPIVIAPFMDSSEYKNSQQEFLKRANLSKEDIQPVGLPVWSDPFKKKD